MERRNTIQKELVRQAVFELRRHVTVDEVYEHIKAGHPTIGKGTVYRNLSILAEEGQIRRIEIPNGPDHFDFTLKNHYHVRCVECGSVSDVDMDEITDMFDRIHDTHGMKFLGYDILFKGICKSCLDKAKH